jgi:GNAT superfamily N-acetyltransferase
MIECRTMAGAERLDAYALMKRFRSDEAALGDALSLFVDRPDYGFVWLAYDDGRPAACVSVAFAISTESGGLVAELRDLWVAPERRRRGIGSALIATLHGRLAHLEVSRIEASVPVDPALRAFFAARGYEGRGESRFSLDRR